MRFLSSLFGGIVLSVAGIAVTLAALEAVGRLQEKFSVGQAEPAHDSNYYARKLLSEYPQLNDDYFHWQDHCQPHFRDYYYISFECRSATLNTTPYFDSRAVPASDPVTSSSKPRLWLFGGSTMLNLTSPDGLTVANYAAIDLHQAFGQVIVVNFGMGAFGLRQEKMKFFDIFSRVPKEERPSTVVFYDGFNDSGNSFTFGPGNFPEDMNGKLRMLVEGDGGNLLPLFFSQKLSGISDFWKINFAPRIDAAFARTLVDRRPNISDDATAAVSVYENDADQIRHFAEAYGIKTLFILQPMIFTKTPLSGFEKEVMKNVVEPNKPHLEYMKRWYAEAARKMAQYPDFADFSHILDNRREDDFFDHGHTGPHTSGQIGISISREIQRRLGEHKAPESSTTPQ